MRNLIIGLLFLAAFSTSGATQAPQATGVTLFEGARLIIGDGAAPIENSAFIVANSRFTQVGRRGQLNVPAGAARVDLTGKTVMPAIVDAHTHMPVKRDALVDSLQRKAFYGAGVVMSLGQDTGDVAFQVREETIPGAARLRTAGRGITMPEPGRTEAPYWITTEAEGRKAVQDQAARKVDLIKIWVDDRDGMFKKLTPARQGHRRRGGHDVQTAPQRVRRAESPRSWSEGRFELAQRQRAGRRPRETAGGGH
jgi:imidazolonepropionase-like amidohydrolase